MSLSDRIAVMNDGRLEQLGTPAEIYESPRSRFVASFIGDANIFRVKVDHNVEDKYVCLQSTRLGEKPVRLVAWKDKQLAPGSSLELSVRPEKLKIHRECPDADPHQNLIHGIVEDMIYLGSQTKYRIRAGRTVIQVLQQHGQFLLDTKPISWDEKVWVSWNADDGHMITGDGK